MAITAASPRILKPLPPTKPMIAVGGAIGFVVIVVLLTSKPEEAWLALVMAGIGALALLLVYLLSGTSRLVISEKGIAYLTPVLNVTSTWDNLLGYGTRIMGVSAVEVLYLREPVPAPALLDLARKANPYLAVLALLTGKPFHMSSLQGYEGFIPISLFDGQWRYGDFGEMMKQHAPQAYNNEIK